MSWTPEQYSDYLRKRAKTAPSGEPPLRGSKYRNVKVEVDGEKFDSKREANYWLSLKAREAAGQITDLRRQVRFPLRCPAVGGQIGVSLVVAEYVADFTYLECGTHDTARSAFHVVDAKGRRICPYPLKKKWLEFQDGILIEEV